MTTRRDPTIRWITVRSITGVRQTLNADCISEMHPVNGGFAVKMVSGFLILLAKREGQRVVNRILAKGITL